MNIRCQESRIDKTYGKGRYKIGGSVEEKEDWGGTKKKLSKNKRAKWTWGTLVKILVYCSRGKY